MPGRKEDRLTLWRWQSAVQMLDLLYQYTNNFNNSETWHKWGSDYGRLGDFRRFYEISCQRCPLECAPLKKPNLNQLCSRHVLLLQGIPHWSCSWGWWEIRLVPFTRIHFFRHVRMLQLHLPCSLWDQSWDLSFSIICQTLSLSSAARTFVELSSPCEHWFFPVLGVSRTHQLF